MSSAFKCMPAVSLAALLVLATFAPVLADDVIEDGKVYRVVRTDGKELVGEVTDLGNVYQIKMSSGIVMKLQKSKVRELIAVEKEPVADPDTALNQQITDEEIEEILGSDSVEDLYVWDYVEPVDLMDPLPYTEDRLRELLRIGGHQANHLATDHFLLVYTAPLAKTKRLAARLESVYKWNVRFMEMMDIPPVRPESKLEIFFFGTHKEFEGYSALHGFNEMGILGFFSHMDNRSAFFDMTTWPPVAIPYERYQDPAIDHRIRKRKLNLIKRYVDFQNLDVIQHECGHHIHFNIGVFPQQGDVPTWVVEGLTMQFEVPPSQLGASLGKINYFRLNQIRQMYGPNGEGLPPMRQFMLSDGMWHAGGGASYPIGWALVNYLYKTNRDNFAGFMRLMAQREDDYGVRVGITEKLRQMEKYFGDIDDEWIKGFKEYIAGIPLRKSELPPSLADIQ